MDDELSPIDPVAEPPIAESPVDVPRSTVRRPPGTKPERGAIAGFFLDTTNRLRTLWRLLIFGIGFIAIYIGLAIACVAGLIVYLRPQAAQRNADNARLSVQTFVEDNDSMLILSGVLIVATLPMFLGWVLGCRKLLDRRSIVSMGFVRPRSSIFTLLLGLLAGALPIAITTAIVLALGGFEWHGTRWTSVVLWSIVPLVLAAFEEEFIFRGYVLQNFLDIRRPILGLVVSSTLFWLAHSFNDHLWTSPLGAINLFFAGILLSLAYLASGNIWFPSIMHFAWNYTQGPLLNIPISGQNVPGIVDLRRVDSAPAWLTGGGFGLEASAVCLLCQIVVAILLFKVWRRSWSAEQAVELIDFLETPNPHVVAGL